jgi:tetratricopeptide (TPR) repeat protein
MQLNPEDHNLAKKIGVALVTTHDYLKAIDYYETALQSAPDSSELHYSLAELYFKLQEYARAIRVLARALEVSSAATAEGDKKAGHKSSGQTPGSMKSDVKLLVSGLQVQ